MSIFLSPALVVSPTSELPARHPVVCWRNQVLINNIAADSEAAGYPVTNLANPSTANRWVSDSTTEQLVTVSGLDGKTDSLSVARHNFGSTGTTVSVEGLLSGGGWEEVFPAVLPAGDSPLMLLFAADFYTDIRLRLVPAGVAPTAAVLFVAESLVLLRPMQPGFTPIGDARSHNLVTGWSASGEMLGAIVDGSTSANSASFVLLDIDWYREKMRPFVQAANLGAPFFFAWNPEAQPSDVAYAMFASGDVQPVLNHMRARHVDITLPMQGVAL